MSSPKESSPVLRYILAGLKPFGRMSLWIPVGIVGVVALSFWQYWTHPEWRGTTQGQTTELEGEIGNNLDIGTNLNDIKSNLSTPSDIIQSPATPSLANPLLPYSSAPTTTENQKGTASSTSPANTLYPLGKSPTNPASGTSSQSFFPPLLPTVKNPGALLPSDWQNKSDRETLRSPGVDTSQNLPQSNPLQSALDQAQSEAKTRSSQTPTPSTNPYSIPNRTTPLPTQPSPAYPNAYGYGNQPISPQPISPNYQNTYPNSYSDPTVPNQPAQVPNNGSSYGIQAPQISDYEGVY